MKCARCLFAACLCADIPAVATRTRVVIVRHVLERHRSSNTGRLAHLALPNSALVDHGGREPATLPPLDGAYLLFPVGDVATEVPPVQQLVVLDATWSQARRMYRKLDALRGLPTLRLPASAWRPRLREAPSLDRVSTIEAIAAALRLLEGDAIAAPLEQLFTRAVTAANVAGRRAAI